MDDRAQDPLLKSSITNQSNSSLHSQTKPPLNQSYNTNHFSGQPPNQPYSSNYMPPPPAQEIPKSLENHPRADLIKENMNLACVICGFNSGSVVRRVAGCVTFSWCICLFLTTAVCCWVPFCTFRCMDIEIICRRCGYVKVILQAECF